ncbi:MAG TPA: tyrosine-type recombinase/integrase [Polyangiaceae bacterium]|nr:tyrosine-type recombinase/integrase [Polyangiaceae bacterium]
MGRKRKGTAVRKRNTWYAQLTVDFLDGESGLKAFRLDNVRTEAEANAAVARLQKAVQGKRFPRKGGQLGIAVTFDVYLERWLEARLQRGRRTVHKDRQRLTDYVLPLLKGKPMKLITANDIRGVVNALDLRVSDPTVKFGWKTAHLTWQALTKLFKDATHGKNPALLVLDTNPCLGLSGPDKGTQPTKQWLYPREFVQLISCEEVPLDWRQAYAVATYLYLRIGELRALHCEDVDLASGMVKVHRSTGEDGKTVRLRTKTGAGREFALNPAVVPLLRHLMAKAGGRGRIFPRLDKAAKRLRAHLKRAGVRRESLHNSSPHSQQMTFHDLRGTGITWAALRGDRLIQIRDQAGHADIEMTNHYMGRASSAGDVGQPFPSLSVLYPATGPTVHSTRPITRFKGVIGDSVMYSVSYPVEPRGIEFPGEAEKADKIPVFASELCPNCRELTRARDIARDSKLGECRPSSVAATAGVLALLEALERLLGPADSLSEYRVRAGLPPSSAEPIACVAFTATSCVATPPQAQRGA